jgi:hypothetical protein
MTNYEFIATVEANYKSDVKDAKSWLKNATRLELKTDFEIDLIKRKKSVIDDSLNSDCVKKINLALFNILECYPTFNSYLLNYYNNTNEFKDILEKIYIDSKSVKKKLIPVDEIASQWNSYLKYNLIDIVRSSNHIELGRNIEQLVIGLEDFKRVCEREKRINDIVYQTNGENFRSILSNLYQIEGKDLPSNSDDEDLAYLGVYKHTGRILIYLDVIYDNAKSLGLNPYFLYRKVLVHELAHAYHHRGLDAKNEIWENFGYSDPTRVFVIEGLAQWYAMQYMLFLDTKDRSSRNENLLTIIWFSLFQTNPYRHYLNWVGYSNENIRRTIVEARAKTGTLERSIDFDRELQLNHSKNI